MKKIAIWTPINSKSGFGHFYRMLGVYEELVKYHLEVNFFTNEEYLKLENIEPISIQTNNIKEIKDFLIDNSFATLIIDNYKIDEQSILYLKNYFKIVHFDAKFENIEVDIIINFNPYAIEKYQKKHKNTRYFLGLNYMRFRNSILKIDKKNSINNSIFINVGGSDIEEITFKIIPYLKKNEFYNIVLGKGCSKEYFDLVKNILNENMLSFNIYHQPENYFEILLSSQKAIVSCSTTSYELIYFSIPFVCIKIVSNQNEISKYLSYNGVEVIEKDRLFEVSKIFEEDKFNLPKNLIYEDNSKFLLKDIIRIHSDSK